MASLAAVLNRKTEGLIQKEVPDGHVAELVSKVPEDLSKQRYISRFWIRVVDPHLKDCAPTIDGSAQWRNPNRAEWIRYLRDKAAPHLVELAAHGPSQPPKVASNSVSVVPGESRAHAGGSDVVEGARRNAKRKRKMQLLSDAKRAKCESKARVKNEEDSDSGVEAVSRSSSVTSSVESPYEDPLPESPSQNMPLWYLGDDSLQFSFDYDPTNLEAVPSAWPEAQLDSDILGSE